MSNALALELRQPSLEQVAKNHRKLLAAAIRLHYSIKADNAIAVARDALDIRLAAMLQEGHIPAMSLADMLDMLDEVL